MTPWWWTYDPVAGSGARWYDECVTLLALALLAFTAGVFFGAVPPEWPWRRPQPVRGTLSFGLLIAALVLLVASRALPWDYTPLARSPYFASVGSMTLVAVWIAPRPAVWSRLTFTFAWAWLAFKVYGHTW